MQTTSKYYKISYQYISCCQIPVLKYRFGELIYTETTFIFKAKNKGNGKKNNNLKQQTNNSK